MIINLFRTVTKAKRIPMLIRMQWDAAAPRSARWLTVYSLRLCLCKLDSILPRNHLCWAICILAKFPHRQPVWDVRPFGQLCSQLSSFLYCYHFRILVPNELHILVSAMLEGSRCRKYLQIWLIHVRSMLQYIFFCCIIYSYNLLQKLLIQYYWGSFLLDTCVLKLYIILIF